MKKAFFFTPVDQNDGQQKRLARHLVCMNIFEPVIRILTQWI